MEASELPRLTKEAQDELMAFRDPSRSEQIDLLTTALSVAQGVMKNAAMNRENSFFKSRYATLAAIHDAIREPLATNGLSWTQATQIRDGKIVLVTTLFHKSGQFISSEFPLLFTGKPQEMGSAMTYTKRYQLSAIVGIAADEDDDGNEAQQVADKTVDRKPIPAKPDVMKEDPISTGDAQAAAMPYQISVDIKPDGTGSDWVKFGKDLIAHIKMAGYSTIAKNWRNLNLVALTEMEKSSPKTFANLNTSITKTINDYEAQEKPNAEAQS